MAADVRARGRINCQGGEMYSILLRAASHAWRMGNAASDSVGPAVIVAVARELRVCIRQLDVLCSRATSRITQRSGCGVPDAPTPLLAVIIAPFGLAASALAGTLGVTTETNSPSALFHHFWKSPAQGGLIFDLTGSRRLQAASEIHQLRILTRSRRWPCRRQVAWVLSEPRHQHPSHAFSYIGAA